MADRFGRKPLLMITILVYSVGTLASGMSVGFWTLMAARAITGIGVGGEWAVAHALVGETVPPQVRGRYGSYLQSGSAFARFFASMVGNPARARHRLARRPSCSRRCRRYSSSSSAGRCPNRTSGWRA